MHSVFYSILPIFLIAFLGSVIRRKWLKSDEFWRGIEKLSFYVLFPSVLFEHTSKVDIDASNFFSLVFALVGANLLVCALLIIYQYKTNFNKIYFTSVFQGGTRYNSYVFFALGAALFGDKGLAIIASIAPYTLILTNITAVMCFAYYVPNTSATNNRINSLVLVGKSIIMNPFIIASVVGLLFNYFNLSLNEGVNKTIESLADSALAIGMLIVGAGIKFKIKPEHMQKVACTSLVKLVLMPVVTFVFLWIMGVSDLARSIGIMFSCLPCATSSYILSRQLGGDHETMSSIITFTTIFSIISLSMLVYMLG